MRRAEASLITHGHDLNEWNHQFEASSWQALRVDTLTVALFFLDIEHNPWHGFLDALQVFGHHDGQG